ncbi:leucine aminopeptidase 2 [Fusarium beomiforme]|uniref:Peptide hydrolase n=1 Tax=Fusarium beomiforme TaxID=44412 RepID=A0A9P5AF98_9HYPO|nr:leucine aminopeptidase 2 [Fusarium beomiforme]
MENIIFNDNPDQKAGSGSLGAENFGKLAPVGAITYDQGNAWAEQLPLVITETRAGDSNNVVMLGGPGIIDNGSGFAALLNIAESAKKYKNFKNKLRFAFWGAGEGGMIGSTYYVSNLSKEEANTIHFYYNNDMIASPKPYPIVYADSDAHKAGAEYLSEYLTDQGYPAEHTPFEASSDYVGFLELEIPSCGIFRGAGAPQDACCHTASDDIHNINKGAFLINAKAAAYAAASLALNLDEVPKHETSSINPLSKRGVARNMVRWVNVARGAERVHSCGSERKAFM